MKHFYLLFVAVFAILTAQSQIVNIPDANFKNALINAGIDSNSDGEIQVSEAEAVGTLYLGNKNIASVEGIEFFVNLWNLDLGNFVWGSNSDTFNTITSIDVSNLTNLSSLNLSFNQLSEIDLSNLNSIGEIGLGGNLFTSIDDIVFPTNGSLFGLSINNNQLTSIEGLPTDLSYLDCQNNQITTLDLSSFTNLSDLNCSNNQLTSLDVSQFNLYEFYCNDNPLTSLTLSSYTAWLNVSNTNLTEIDLSNLNGLTSLNISNCPNLIAVDLAGTQVNGFTCINNPVLEYISFKNGIANMINGDYYEGNYNICNNPNLKFVCADPGEIENYVETNPAQETYTVHGVQQFVDNCGYGNVIVSSYCNDFVAGGEFYTIQGASSLDANSNGCDAGDSNIPNLKYNITQGFNAGSFTSDELGNYTYLVQEGSHTITPELENPDYFTVSPSSYTVNFPTDTSPFIRDFCITPNGTHNDLEVTLIPVELARPGFDANYKLVYKNKGTTTLSGTVDLTFQDELMDLVSATPIASSQSTGFLSWNFTDLVPIESREILFTMNLNTPTDTPPLNGDDVLGFTATVNPVTGDETIEDNTSQLNQTVVNSYDPNDKTCLEGNTITPDLIGEYVNYLIRFENTGTASAINVVVKYVIDVTKFDIYKLFVKDASHNVVTSITNTDEVRFSFENINLPFDDANNDGYIAFKIKTLDTLVEGDTFENDAQIFFDYNFPIQTNIAQTSIQSPLSTNDFELSGLESYPNPVNDKLFIDGVLGIKSVSIYDISGRLINQVSYLGNHNSIEFSTEKLTRGNYFVKVKTDAGEFVKKVVKE